MAASHNLDELLSFPCLYEFKAFGETADEQFRDNVCRAVSRVVPVGEDAMRSRSSSGGRYQCLTVLVRLENSTQLEQIYVMLRSVEGLRYLL
jgi:putative lipoic acid-binding regulatory protein